MPHRITCNADNTIASWKRGDSEGSAPPAPAGGYHLWGVEPQEGDVDWPWAWRGDSVGGSVSKLAGAAYDTAAAEKLDELKTELMIEIDNECERRIHEATFEWPPASGNQFSLTANAQIKWVGMQIAKDAYDYVTDPPKVKTKDDRTEYTLVDAADVNNAYLTAMGTVRAFLNANREAKNNVLAATTEAGARAARDTYFAS